MPMRPRNRVTRERAKRKRQERLPVHSSRKIIYVPVTPGGSYLFELAAKTRVDAIEKLRIDSCDRYPSWEAYVQRGYRIHKLEEV